MEVAKGGQLQSKTRYTSWSNFDWKETIHFQGVSSKLKLKRTYYKKYKRITEEQSELLKEGGESEIISQAKYTYSLSGLLTKIG